MTVTFATAINAILDGMLAALVAEQTPEGDLPDVLIIKRIDRAEPSPEYPAIYLRAETMRISSRDGTFQNLSEWWDFPVTIHAVVNSDTPTAGYDSATDLAARATAILRTLNSQNLGLPYVRDIRAAEFEPAGPWSREGDYYRAMAKVVVLFNSRG